MPRLIACLFLLASLAGCASTPDAPEDPIVVRVPPDAVYVQESSGFQFPPQVAGFARHNVTEYDTDGLNVGVVYAHDNPDILMTVFVYPVPLGVAGQYPQHYQAAKSDIVVQHLSVQLISEEQIQISSGGLARPGMHAVYSFRAAFAGQDQPVLSELYLFGVGKHFYKYRATYPASQKEAARTAIDAFINSLVWP